MSTGNLSRVLLDKIGSSIVCGDYVHGENLPSEAEIAKTNQVSRTATREAMKMLAAKGLIKAWPRRGTVVQKEEDWNLLDRDVMTWILGRGPSISLVKDFLSMRLAIEPAAAEMAASKGADTIEIANAIKMMRSAKAGGEGDALTADCMFHAAILRASENRFFAQMSPLVDTALRMTIRVTNQIKGVRMASIEEHEEIFFAIRDQRPEEANKLIQSHISAALKLIETAYPYAE